MDNKSRSPFGESAPIYYEISPKIVWALRILGICTALMVLLAFIFCLVKATGNHNFYMLAVNVLMTSCVGLVNTWWYWKGQLAADKHWYMMLVGLVIIWQCIATDVYVFHLPPSSSTGNATTMTTMTEVPLSSATKPVLHFLSASVSSSRL